MNEDLVNESQQPPEGWTRRRFLSTSAMGLAVVGVGGSLAACSSSGTPGPTDTASGGASATPKKGGTLRVGASGGATTDTLDPQNWATAVDQLRNHQLFDTLVTLAPDGSPQLSLATSITPNSDATEWTIKIPADITTHAGKPFTADDVLYSFQRIVSNKYAGAAVLGPADLKSSKVVDSTTVLLKYPTPYSILVESLSLDFFGMVPRGFDPKKPDGTGPFKYKTFTPGVESTFVRNDNYWQSGKPYLDQVVTININDESAQVAGLQSGQFDVITQLSAGSVAALQGGEFTVDIQKSGGWVPFTMHTGLAPFSDVRVRQAFRLIVDRKQMLEQVFGGYGEVGNDVMSPFDPSYPTDLPQREQDIAQAKSLLKAAGQENLSVEMVTKPATAGEVAMTQVFATQAKDAGVNVKITQQAVGDFYTTSYLKVPFATDYGPSNLYLVNAAQLLLGDVSFFNATHFNDPEYNSLYKTAISTVDLPKRADVIHQMARIDYDRGGYIVPLFTPAIQAYTSKLGGIVKPCTTGLTPGNADFANFWLG